MSRKWSHDDLAADLAGHLTAPERMTWQNMQLGSHGSQRPDVYAIYKSYANPNPSVYECKISVSDFRSDVTTGKWRGYLEFAWSVIFAVPVGLITKDQVPEMCGLIVRHENCWRMAKKATVCPRPIDQDCLLKLLIDGVNREGPKYRAKRWHEYDPIRSFTKKFGSEAARYVSDAAETHRRIERAEYDALRIMDHARDEAKAITDRSEKLAPQLWVELLSSLGLDAGATRWAVEARIREFKQQRAGSEELRALEQVARFMERFTVEYGHLLKDAPNSQECVA